MLLLVVDTWPLSALDIFGLVQECRSLSPKISGTSSKSLIPTRQVVLLPNHWTLKPNPTWQRSSTRCLQALYESDAQKFHKVDLSKCGTFLEFSYALPSSSPLTSITSVILKVITTLFIQKQCRIQLVPLWARYFTMKYLSSRRSGALHWRLISQRSVMTFPDPSGSNAMTSSTGLHSSI